jgi:Replication-relaxation
MPTFMESPSSRGCLFSGRNNTRTKRTERRQAVSKVQITLRDKAILQALAESKFLSTSMIGRLCFGRVNSTLRLRLRRLLDGGFIRVWMPSLNAENLYSLDKKAVSFLLNNSSSEPGLVVPRRLERKMAHLLAINEFHISLSLALAAKGSKILCWRPDWIKNPGQRGLLPDAVFQVQLNSIEATFALEMDMGGEPAQTVFGSKLRRYCYQYELSGSQHDCLLVVTTTIQRLYALLRTAAKEPGAADFLFTVKDRTSGNEILAKVWTSARLALSENNSNPFVSLTDLLACQKKRSLDD